MKLLVELALGFACSMVFWGVMLAGLLYTLEG